MYTEDYLHQRLNETIIHLVDTTDQSHCTDIHFDLAMQETDEGRLLLEMGYSPAISMTSGIGDTAWTHPRLLADRSSCFNSVLYITVFPGEGER